MFDRYVMLSISDLAIMRWPEDRHDHGNQPPFNHRVESVRRACETLSDEGLIWWSWSHNWQYKRGPFNRSPVGYVPAFGETQRMVCSMRVRFNEHAPQRQHPRRKDPRR
jgi:hypothetical protein